MFEDITLITANLFRFVFAPFVKTYEEIKKLACVTVLRASHAAAAVRVKRLNLVILRTVIHTGKDRGQKHILCMPGETRYPHTC